MGGVTYTVCGDLPNHYVKGDVASIADEIGGALSLDPVDRAQVGELVRNVYTKQRIGLRA